MKRAEKILIIGNGIASWALSAELSSLNRDMEILCIDGASYVNRCSFQTTSVNCLRGTRKGISPLGDLIVDSYHAFEDFYLKNAPQGIEKSSELQVWREDSPAADKWRRRFSSYSHFTQEENVPFSSKLEGCRSDAYLFSPNAFFTWHRNKFTNVLYEDDFVVGVTRSSEGFVVTTQKGKHHRADKVFVCCGILSHLFMDLAENEEHRKYFRSCRPVSGSYMQCDASLGEVGFSIAFEHYHLIYRSLEKIMILGQTSKNNCAVQISHTNELERIYTEVCTYLGESYQLPPFQAWDIHHGIRHKGHRRMPFWGEISSDVYAVCGLYKNAFSFSFLAAKELAKILV